MKLEQYFERPTEAGATTTQGTQTDWMDFCELTLKGPSFLMVDASFLPSEEDGVVVEAPRGRYLLQAKVMEYGTDRRISRLRVILHGATGAPGKQLGETWTDTAQTAVCDLKVFSAAWGDDDDASYEKIEDALMDSDSFGIAVLDKKSGARAPFVSSGFGDGTFPVVELLENGKRVGFEVEFIGEGEPYPFEEKSRNSHPEPEGRKDSSSEAAGKKADLFSRLGEALFSAGKGKSDESKEERKESMMGVFKQFEDELLGEGKAACAEYRQHLRDVRAKAPPPRMEIRPAQEIAFCDTPEARERILQLTQAGFIPAGHFETAGASGAMLAAFVHPEHRLSSTLTFAGTKISCDMDADYSDGTEFEVTDNVEYSWMRQPPWKTKLRRQVSSLGELLRIFLENAPAKPRPALSAAQVLSNVREGTKRAMDWRNDVGGLSREELKAMATQRNPAKASDEAWLDGLRLDSAERALFNWLRIQEHLTFKPEEVMETLFIIHDELTPELLVLAFWCGTSDFKAKAEDFAGEDPRGAFARVNAERGGKLRKVAEKTTGLKADYYLMVEESHRP